MTRAAPSVGARVQGHVGTESERHPRLVLASSGHLEAGTSSIQQLIKAFGMKVWRSPSPHLGSVRFGRGQGKRHGPMNRIKAVARHRLTLEKPSPPSQPEKKRRSGGRWRRC